VKIFSILCPPLWSNFWFFFFFKTAIMLSRFGSMTNEDIKKAIVNMDENAMILENLQSLQPFVPLPEEVEQLKEYINSPADMLGKAEAFLITVRQTLIVHLLLSLTRNLFQMMSIPILGPKLSSWEYMRSFDQKYSVVQNVRLVLHIVS